MRCLLAATLILAATPALAQRGPGGGGRHGGDQAQQTPAAGQDQRPAGSERPTVMVEPAGVFIAACDADGDGRTTRAELATCVERSFRAVDKGGTGRMGYIDFADWAERYLGERSALPSPFAVDTNGDNVITMAELQAAMAHLFDRFDANKDGAVTRAELLTIRETPGGDRAEGGRRGRGGGRGGRNGGQGGSPPGG